MSKDKRLSYIEDTTVQTKDGRSSTSIKLPKNQPADLTESSDFTLTELSISDHDYQ
jgi:hypothetical protein